VLDPATGDDTAMNSRIGDRRHSGEAFAAVAAMGFGSAYVATSVALRSFSPVSAAFYRSLVATVALGLLVLVLRRLPGLFTAAVPAVGAAIPGRVHRAARLLLIAILGGPVFLASMNMAVAHVGATIAAFVAGLYAVLAAVIAPALLPERLAARVLAGFVLALAGTALLAELSPVSTDLAGLGWGLAAAIAFALYLVLARRWSRTNALDGPTVAFALLGVSVVVLGAVALLSDAGSLAPASVDLSAAAAIGWLALVAVGGQILTIASVRLIPAARSAAFLLLNPITATILATILLGERPSPPQMLGGLLVLAGIAAATVPRRGTDRGPVVAE
jgi:drug/metabolite transporter (DMT)-like permease